MWLLLPAVAFAECDPAARVSDAYRALAGGDTAASEAHLAAAEEALGCAPVARETLVRFWLVEGGLLVALGDAEADLSFAAARRLDADAWLADLPDAARAAWRAAVAPEGTGGLSFDVSGRPVLVDGAPWDGAEVAAGLHAVQVADTAGAIRFGAIVYVGGGALATVATGIPPEPPPPGRATAVRIEAETGASLAFGRGLAAGGLTEPATKLVVPLGILATALAGRAWFRAELAVGPLVGGPYLSSRADGSLHRTPVRVDADVALGLASEELAAGVSTGVEWPGRLAQRGVLRVPATGRVAAEVRAGFNLATARPVEPAVEALVAFALAP